MLEAIMLDENAKRKLLLFKFLIKFSDKKHSINFFENNLDYSYSRVVYLLDLIQQDLTNLTGEAVQLIQAKGVQYNQNISYDMYYQYLLTNSIPYQLLVSMLYYPKDNLDKFCEKNFHSKTTVVRRSKLLSDYFKQFNIKMNTTQLRLSGDERVIRITFYTLIWSTSQGVNLPEIINNPFNYARVKKVVSPYFPDSSSYSAHKQIALILDILYLRVRSGYILHEKTEIMPYIPINTDQMNALFNGLVTNPQTLAAEAEFSAYLLISAPNFFRKNDRRLTLITDYLKKQPNQATKLLKEFCTLLSEQIMPQDFSWENESILFGNIVNIIFSSAIIKKPFPTLFHLVNRSRYANNEYYHQLHSQLKKFFQKVSKRKDFNWLKESIPQLSDSLASLLVPVYESFQLNNVVRVALIAESNYLLIQPLTKFIDEISFVQLVAYKQGAFSSFDFILATSAYLIPKESPLPSFVFRFSADNDNQYIELYEALKALHNQKIISTYS